MATPCFAVKASGETDKGLVRETNQDSFWVDPEKMIFIVADGMGGHAGGEIASSLCVSEIVNHLDHSEITPAGDSLTSVQKAQILKTLSSCVNHASAKIYEHSLEEPSLRGMGTTTTLLKIIHASAFCAHVGDSRLYLLRSGFLYQMSSDHSLVQEQLRAGLITEEEANFHHLRNVITRSVGYQEEEEVDVFDFDLQKDDLLLLCSDGLHGKVSDGEISAYMKKMGLDSVNSLIKLANDRGGEDNITVVVVQIQE